MWNGNGQSSSPIVQVKDVVKRFHVGDGDVTILKGISLDIMPGEFVAIVGPSGNGKSTLLNMMTGIDHPSEGQVIVTGQSVHTMSENELAVWRGEHLGIIFQFFQLLPALSLLKNVMLPMDPPLLVADEPTGNLDSTTAEDVFQLFLKLVGAGKTMVMVTHSRTLAARGSRVIEIRDGLIASDSCQLSVVS